MRLLTILGVGVGSSLVALVIMLVIKAQASKAGLAPGLQGGRLSPCSVKPNCVNSEDFSSADKRVAPLDFDGDPRTAWQRLQQSIEAQGGVLVRVQDDYLAATFTSSLFGFVDDLEARLELDKQQIQLRSASRVGHSDLGANRTRVELLRRQFNQR